MKKLIILGICMILNSASAGQVQVQALVRAASQVSASLEGTSKEVILGGMSEGGGGLVNPFPLSMELVEFAVARSKQFILYTLYKYENKFANIYCGPNGNSDNPYCTAFRKMFLRTPDVFRVLEGVQIELRTDESCQDQEGNYVDEQGNPIDGSIHWVQKGNICISGKNLIEKLNSFFYEPQIFALVIHELSHLVGGNKAEAMALQDIMLTNLASNSVLQLKRAANDTRRSFQYLNGLLDYFTSDISYVCYAPFMISSNFLDPVYYASRRGSIPFQFARRSTVDQTLETIYRLGSMFDYRCTQKVANLILQGENELLEEHEVEINRSLLRYSRLLEHEEIPMTEYFQERTFNDKLEKIAIKIGDGEIKNTLSVIDETDFQQMLLRVHEDSQEIYDELEEVTKGRFNVIHRPAQP